MDAEQNKESAKNKITMPVLVLGGDIYPALGGDSTSIRTFMIAFVTHNNSLLH